MYTEHFGLNKLPFENVPDPAFFFNHGNYQSIRRRLGNSLKAGRGLILVTGPIGSGKTTLSQMIKPDLSEHTKLIWMAEPPQNSNDLMVYLIQELGLKPSPSKRVFVLRDIKQALSDINSKGGNCLMIIDESHLVSVDTLNGIRMLNNLEKGSTKLIQILLLGQEELIDKIKRPEMEPFKQRIAALENIGKMDVNKICEYIAHRIQVAGGVPSILTVTGWKAIRIVFKRGGVPRTINSLCDMSFIVAQERNRIKIDANDVHEATDRLGVETDVFHYIVALKTKARQRRMRSATRTEQINEAKTLNRKTEEKSEHTALHDNTPEREDTLSTLPYIQDAKQKSIRMPVLFLGISIMTLVICIIFFNNRSACSDLMTCLMEIFRF